MAREIHLEDVALEVIIEKVGGTAGDQSHQVVEDLLVDPAEVPGVEAVAGAYVDAGANFASSPNQRSE